MSQLQGMNRCLFRRQHRLATIKEPNTNIIRREVIKKCIYGYQNREMNWQQVVDTVFAEAYTDDDTGIYYEYFWIGSNSRSRYVFL